MSKLLARNSIEQSPYDTLVNEWVPLAEDALDHQKENVSMLSIIVKKFVRRRIDIESFFNSVEELLPPDQARDLIIKLQDICKVIEVYPTAEDEIVDYQTAHYARSQPKIVSARRKRAMISTVEAPVKRRAKIADVVNQGKLKNNYFASSRVESCSPPDTYCQQATELVVTEPKSPLSLCDGFIDPKVSAKSLVDQILLAFPQLKGLLQPISAKSHLYENLALFNDDMKRLISELVKHDKSYTKLNDYYQILYKKCIQNIIS